MTTVIAFDVNETLLDLRALDGAFEDLLGSAALRPQWFAQMLQLSLVGGLTGEYVDFSTAQHAALVMLAQRVGQTVTPAQATELVRGMESLPSPLAGTESSGASRGCRSVGSLARHATARRCVDELRRSGG